MKEPALEERFWSKVDKSGECWLWLGCLSPGGYGHFRITYPKRLMVRAHRVAYELTVGPIPNGLTVDHLCRNRACVNPAHLELVTQRENILRGRSFAAENAQKTHCVHGHLYDEANTYIRPNGRRDCRACFRERTRRYSERKGAA